jgi:RNA binding exosome subunit
MDATVAREHITEEPLQKLEQMRYPHVGLMTRIEGRLKTREELERYVKILMAKVKETEYRSETMLDRIDGITGLLERLDKRQAQHG